MRVPSKPQLQKRDVIYAMWKHALVIWARIILTPQPQLKSETTRTLTPVRKRALIQLQLSAKREFHKFQACIKKQNPHKQAQINQQNKETDFLGNSKRTQT